MVPRRLAGLGPEVTVERNGIRWALDLREGIDLSIYLFGAFEPRTVAAYRRLVRLGSTVLDIGANRGAHTLPLAQAVGATGQVVAFEATASALTTFQRTLDLNPALASRVTVCHSVLNEGAGRRAQQALYASWPVDSRAELPGTHPLHRGVPMSTEGARAETIDDAVARLGCGDVAFIKLDVDGNEPSVLRGATQLLRRCRPTILLELAPYGHVEQGEAADALETFFADAGYELVSFGGVPLAAGVSRRMRAGRSVNVFARPRLRRGACSR